jgi:uncharacterized membrane protein
MNDRVFAHVRRQIVRGLFLVLPLLVTIWLLGLLFEVVDKNVTPLVHGVLVWAGIPGLERWFARMGIPIVGLLCTFLTIYLLGLLAGNLAGRRLVRSAESFILRIPVVKGIYGSARQLLDAFSFGGTRTFSTVVMVEYPRKGLWTLGFVTTENEHRLRRGRSNSVSVVPVFLPTTPNPTSGWLLLVPTGDLRVLDMTIEEGMKLIVSGGIVSPANLGSLVRTWKRKPANGERLET